MQKLILNSKELKKKGNKDNMAKPWEKFYPEGVTSDLVFPENTMVGYFLDSVSRYPENIAMIINEGGYTGQQIFCVGETAFY